MSVSWQDHDDYPELALNAESRGEREDELAPVRGIINGLAAAAICWGVIGIGIWIWRSVK